MSADAVELVVAVLAAWVKARATAAVKDAYASLVAAVRGPLNRSSARAESVLDLGAYAADPDVHCDALVAALVEAGVDGDHELVVTAEHLLRQVDGRGLQASKNVVGQLRAKAVGTGHNHMTVM